MTTSHGRHKRRTARMLWHCVAGELALVSTARSTPTRGSSALAVRRTCTASPTERPASPCATGPRHHRGAAGQVCAAIGKVHTRENPVSPYLALPHCAGMVLGAGYVRQQLSNVLTVSRSRCSFFTSCCIAAQATSCRQVLQ